MIRALAFALFVFGCAAHVEIPDPYCEEVTVYLGDRIDRAWAPVCDRGVARCDDGSPIACDAQGFVTCEASCMP